MNRTIRFALAAGTALMAVDSSAQPSALSAASLKKVVETISADSTAGRATPSAELDLAARMVAAMFASAGLTPGGDDGGFLQRYPLSRSVLDESAAGVTIDTLVTWRFGRDFYIGGGFGGKPAGTLRGPVVFVSGATRDNASSIDVKGKVVIYLPPAGARGRPDYGPVFGLGRSMPIAIIVPGALNDSTWRRMRQDPDELSPDVEPAWPRWGPARAAPANAVRGIPIVELWSRRITEFAQRAGLDVAALRNADGSPKLTPLGRDAVLDFTRKIERIEWAPNVVAVLPGSDPALRHEHVVLTAHLDGLGRNPNAPPGPESVFNGADDNASGVAGIVQMARAFAAGTRPKRTLVFVAVSGEETGLWGSDWFAGHPTGPAGSIVANVNLDMIGRPTADTLFVTGQRASSLGDVVRREFTRLKRGLVLRDEMDMERRYPGESYDTRSDHQNFRRRGVPSIWFYTGTHADYHETTDDADRLNYDAMSRIVGAAFDVTAAVANGASRPTNASRVPR
jgi:hypothetical protein